MPYHVATGLAWCHVMGFHLSRGVRVPCNPFPGASPFILHRGLPKACEQHVNSMASPTDCFHPARLDHIE